MRGGGDNLPVFTRISLQKYNFISISMPKLANKENLKIVMTKICLQKMDTSNAGLKIREYDMTKMENKKKLLYTK